MSRKRPPKREHKLIAFKAFFDTDRDILEWWEGMQDGERSAVMRDLLRVYLQGLPLVEAARRQTVPVDGNAVLQVLNDTAWIRGALDNMPAYLEALLGRVGLNSIPMSVAQPRSEASDDSLSNDALARRKAKLGKAGW
ncbi:MAG: hypothetical protein IAE80_18370 [Anaerolinea sp.]|nr:hypothetical protein [Anaerolinea sp.]